MPRHNLKSSIALLTLFLFTTGCSFSPLAKRTSAFSTAAVSAAKDTASAYEVVEQTHNDAEIAALVANYDTEGFHPEKIQPFMSANDMETRTRILNGLSQYAETLAYISGDQPLTDVDAKTSAMGKSLHDLANAEALGSFTKSAHISDSDLNIAATALDALGRALIDRRRSRELPGILKEMKLPIEQICNLLEADIGDPEKSGLRNQLKNDYETLLQKQEKFIKDGGATLSASDKRAAIEELPKIVAAESRGDKTLAATQKALQQLARTHDALADTANAKDSPAFKTMLSELIGDGQQLHSFYEQMPAQ